MKHTATAAAGAATAAFDAAAIRSEPRSRCLASSSAVSAGRPAVSAVSGTDVVAGDVTFSGGDSWASWRTWSVSRPRWVSGFTLHAPVRGAPRGAARSSSHEARARLLPAHSGSAATSATEKIPAARLGRHAGFGAQIGDGRSAQTTLVAC